RPAQPSLRLHLRSIQRPNWRSLARPARRDAMGWPTPRLRPGSQTAPACASLKRTATTRRVSVRRSEEHTSELQSRFDLVCRLLLEKKTISPLLPSLYINHTLHKSLSSTGCLPRLPCYHLSFYRFFVYFVIFSPLRNRTYAFFHPIR